MFNDEIKQFDGQFVVDKTYFISNGEIRKVNQDYINAHPEKELQLKKYTIVKNDHEYMKKQVNYNFTNFRDITEEEHKTELIGKFLYFLTYYFIIFFITLLLCSLRL